MPKNPDSRRYLSPSKRGYSTVYVATERKKAIVEEAKRRGLTVDDYIWSLHTRSS